MSSALSGHLVEQYYTFHQSRAPFGQPFHASQLATNGPMSFAPQMHGSFPSQPAFLDQSMASMNAAPSYMDMSEATARKVATLQAKLDKKLGPEYISQRPGPGGGPKLTYAEGWKIINLANEVFGFNGWSSSVVNLNTDFIDYNEETRRFTVGVSAVIRVTLRDGVFHEDVGYGMLENSKSKGAALDKCKKEAVTDGVKRSLRNFGNLLGNCLYDKQYTQEVIKIKVPPTKFDKDALHRRPEFDPSITTANQPIASTSNASSSSTTAPVARPPAPPAIPKAIGVNSYTSTKPMSAVPQHMHPNAASTPIRNMSPPGARVPAKTGLNTPMQTPQGRPGPSGPGFPQAPNTGISAAPSPILPSHLRQGNQVQPTRQLPRPLAQPPVHQQHSVPANPTVPAQQQRAQSLSVQDMDGRDMYSFNSDDDELLAALDLGEGEGGWNETEADIGRPIGNNEGVGGAIDFEGTFVEATNQSTLMASSGAKTVSEGVASDPDAVVQDVKRPNQNHTHSTTKPDSNAQGGQHVRQQGFQATRHGDATSRDLLSVNQDIDEDDIGNQITALRQQRNAMRNAKLARTHNADEDATSGASLPPSNGKSRAPTMGGFNFPPGVNGPAAAASTSARQPYGTNAHAGVKRNSDAMISPSTSRGPGMGLAQSQAGGLSTTRQPLATIGGGDLKRPRR
ncbi:hypothetical protein M0805_003449 [Coniferiporia weirii]|nr:hypothetical protein M0805_003449 [Coniferiporia weirii]